MLAGVSGEAQGPAGRYAGFWAGRDPSAQADRGRVEATLEHMLAQARAAQPDLSLASADYFAYLAERIGDAAPLDGLERIDAAELYLVRACAEPSSGERALRRFEDAYFREVQVGASRLRCTAEEVDEITQRVRLALFAPDSSGRLALLDKTARGDLRALIRLMALRAGISLRRSQGRELEDVDAALEFAASEDIDGLAIKAEYRAKFRVSLAAAIERLEPKQRALLRLHEVDGVSVANLARMVQVDRSTITRKLAAARATILAETRRELGERFGVPRHHFESFIDVIRSNFGASIHRVLGENSDG